MAVGRSHLDAGGMAQRSSVHVSQLALAGAVAQVVFIVSWLVVGAVERHGYQPMRDDISDLGASTAQHALTFRLLLFITGTATMAFGVLVVGPVLRSTASGVLVALSLPGFDNLTDTFFRVDCRAADVGCDPSQMFASWHARMHLVCFAVAALATVVAPFVIARAMRRDEAWRSTARSVRWFGALTIALLLGTAAASGSPVQGAVQRLAASVIPLALAWLAVRVAHLPARVPRVAGLIGGR